MERVPLFVSFTATQNGVRIFGDRIMPMKGHDVSLEEIEGIRFNIEETGNIDHDSVVILNFRRLEA